MSTYSVVCDHCNGSRHINGLICRKCLGEGMIEVSEEQLTFSQATAKKAGKIVLFAVAVAIVLVVVLHFWGVL